MVGVGKSKLELKKLYNYICILFKKYDINFIPFYGTLLGITRNNDFIEMDDDIDILVSRYYHDKIKEIIEKENIISKFHGTWEKNDSNNTNEQNDIIQLFINGLGPIDIYFYDILGVDLLIKWDGNLLFETKHIFPLKKYKFKDLEITRPSNPDKILKSIYGKDYLIPKKKYEYDWKKYVRTKDLNKIGGRLKISKKNKKIKKNKSKFRYLNISN